jgi:hypothetical protein
MAAKLDNDEKQVIVVALFAMAQEVALDDRDEAWKLIGSIVDKLSLRAAAEDVLTQAAAAKTPTKREDVE